MSIKIGFGLYYHMLNDEYLKFARQCGATHLTVHLVDYFNKGIQQETGNSNDQPIGNEYGWGIAGSNPHVWEVEYLLDIKARAAKFDLEIEAIENFDPSDWYDILLGGENHEQQMLRLSTIIKNVGAAGIPIVGYNFSLAGVSSRGIGENTRGGAKSVIMTEVDETPIPQGMIWNMTYDTELIKKNIPHKEATHEELWERYEWFITRLAPVAEKANVRLALHPDDPPMPVVRRQPRLVYQADLYQRSIDCYNSKSNSLELCLGTLQEMPNTNVYEYLEKYLSQDRVAYIHFRNVVGCVPHYNEVFVDEGDLDMARVVSILKKYNFDGMIIPDHTPQMTCDAPWHAGMAYAMGYMNALNKIL